MIRAKALRWALGAALSVWLCGAQAAQAAPAVQTAQTTSAMQAAPTAETTRTDQTAPAMPATQTDEAAQAAPAALDPALEKRVLQLAQELRCLVCQNQTIADSHAPLAVELKSQVREQLARGQSNQDVIDFMVQRYGDFVLYRPPVRASTWLLWFGPFLLLALGLSALILKLRQKPTAPADSLTAAELADAAALLAGQSLANESTPAARSIPAAATVSSA